MNKLITLIVAAIIILTAYPTKQTTAQTTSNMNYQAVIRDLDGNLIANQQIGMQISILQGAADGSAVYVEIHYPTTNENGLATLHIGNGNVVSGDYLTIDWADGSYFLKTETDLEGGEDFTITGTSPLLSVPYALHARVADSIAYGGIETDPIFSESVAFGITETDTTNWNNKLDVEVDGDTGNELQDLSISGNTISLTSGGSVDLPPETDPVFGASVSSGITEADTTYWNDHTDSTDVANMGYTAFILLSQDAEGRLILSDNGATSADPASILDIQSTTKGFLLPRMTYAEMLAIPGPPDGLMVIDSTSGRIFMHAENEWVHIITNDILEIKSLDDAASNDLYNSYYIGSGAGTGFSQSANLTTAVGSSAGVGFGEGDFNTAIGATAGPSSGTQDLHNTTTIGYNSKAEYSHQVVLGTVNDTVVFPNTTRLKLQANLPTAHVGSLAVKDADSNLYYNNGSDWQQVTETYKVGDLAFGGIIYYVDETGKHGLVCGLVDADVPVRWAEQNNNNNTNAQGDGIYAGAMNTAIAIAALRQLGNPSAALSCSKVTSTSPFISDYGDWYLPSKKELKFMYDNKEAINTTLTNESLGILIGNDVYWSSTEHETVVNEAYAIDFSTGLAAQVVKQTVYHVRAVRRF